MPLAPGRGTSQRSSPNPYCLGSKVGSLSVVQEGESLKKWGKVNQLPTPLR